MRGPRKLNTEPYLGEKIYIYSPEEVQQLENSEYALIRHHVIPWINPSSFDPFYSATGRPSHPVDVCVGVMFLATLHHTTDVFILNQLPFNHTFQYALCMEKDDPIPSVSTMIRFRGRIIETPGGIEIYNGEIRNILQHFTDVLGLDSQYGRMDSYMLDSYFRPMSRTQLLYQSIQGVVLLVVGTSKTRIFQEQRESILTLPEVFSTGELTARGPLPSQSKASLIGLPERLKHYASGSDYNLRFYRKNSSKENAAMVLEDAALVLRLYKDGYESTDEYQILARVVNEQCFSTQEFVSVKDEDGMLISSSSKKVLRFRTSKEEQAEQKKADRELANLEKDIPRQQRVWEQKEKQAQDAKVSSVKADHALKNSERKAERADQRLEKAVRDLEKAAQTGGEDEEKAKAHYQTALDRKDEAHKRVETAREDAAKKRELADKKEEARCKARSSFLEAQDRTIEFHTKKAEEGAFYILDDIQDAVMDSNILQSISDPNATYCRKYSEHRGYKVCALEYGNGRGRSMITDWVVATNNTPDSIMGATLIARDVVHDSPCHLITDGAFSGQVIEEAAELRNIQLEHTELTGRKEKDCYADIVFDESDSRIISCPAGKRPDKYVTDKKDNETALMGKSKCSDCPLFKECAPNRRKEGYALKATKTQCEKAAFQREKGSETHRSISAFRNGSEATMSLIKKYDRVSREPIYGPERVQIFTGMAILAAAFTKFSAQLMGKKSTFSTIPTRYEDVFMESDAELEMACEEISREFSRESASQKADAVEDVVSAPVNADDVSEEKAYPLLLCCLDDQPGQEASETGTEPDTGTDNGAGTVWKKLVLGPSASNEAGTGFVAVLDREGTLPGNFFHFRLDVGSSAEEWPYLGTGDLYVEGCWSIPPAGSVEMSEEAEDLERLPALASLLCPAYFQSFLDTPWLECVLSPGLMKEMEEDLFIPSREGFLSRLHEKLENLLSEEEGGCPASGGAAPEIPMDDVLTQGTSLEDSLRVAPQEEPVPERAPTEKVPPEVPLQEDTQPGVSLSEESPPDRESPGVSDLIAETKQLYQKNRQSREADSAHGGNPVRSTASGCRADRKKPGKRKGPGSGFSRRPAIAMNISTIKAPKKTIA